MRRDEVTGVERGKDVRRDVELVVSPGGEEGLLGAEVKE